MRHINCCGTKIAYNKCGRDFPSFPVGREFNERGKIKVMKVLQNILFTFAMVVGLSLGVSAQKDGDKKPPPKNPAPRIDPAPPKPPKKPGGNAFVVIWKNDTGYMA